jgi:predicted ester cyclase
VSDHQKDKIIRWFEEVWNQGRRETIDELLPPDCVIHDGVTEAKGPEDFKLFYDRMRRAFSDMHVTPAECLSEGDLVCLRWSVTMRHTGDGLGMPPTGKRLHTTGNPGMNCHGADGR